MREYDSPGASWAVLLAFAVSIVVVWWCQQGKRWR
jgi:hypothetical protein